MARTPSTSDLCNAEANKAYDKLTVISENIDKLNELAEYIFDLKDWLKFTVGIYLNDYVIELETKCAELQIQFDHLKDVVETNKEESLRLTDSLTDELAALENQVNGLLLPLLNPDDLTHGATCRAIADYVSIKVSTALKDTLSKVANLDTRITNLENSVNNSGSSSKERAYFYYVGNGDVNTYTPQVGGTYSYTQLVTENGSGTIKYPSGFSKAIGGTWRCIESHSCTIGPNIDLNNLPSGLPSIIVGDVSIVLRGSKSYFELC